MKRVVLFTCHQHLLKAPFICQKHRVQETLERNQTFKAKPQHQQPFNPGLCPRSAATMLSIPEMVPSGYRITRCCQCCLKLSVYSGTLTVQIHLKRKRGGKKTHTRKIYSEAHFWYSRAMRVISIDQIQTTLLVVTAAQTT